MSRLACQALVAMPAGASMISAASATDSGFGTLARQLRSAQHRERRARRETASFEKPDKSAHH